MRIARKSSKAPKPPSAPALPRAVATGQKTKVEDASSQRITNRSSSEADYARNTAAGPGAPNAILMPKCGNKLNALPSFILSLSKKYFATLFSALFASEHPFDHFKKNSAQFLTISRTAFKHVWPELEAQLQVDDILFNIVSSLTLDIFRFT
jgi:hypothetical protein